jgi:hypothetical protein
VRVIADPIADLRSPTGSLISLYAQRPAPGGFPALLADLLRPVRERADGFERSIAKSIRSDAEAIHDLADRFESGVAPAYAVFASAGDGIFVVEQLTHDVPDVGMVGPRPYIRPLRAAPRALRSGVLVADTTRARVFTVQGGVVSEVDGPVHVDDVGRPNYGGFSGYQEHVVRGRVAEATMRMWRTAGQMLLDEHQDRPFDYVALGGQDETFEELGRYLHPYLSRLPRTTFPANPGGITHQTIRAEVSAADSEMRRRREERLAERVTGVALSGGNAVLGLGPALEAANFQAIDTLLVAGEYARDGSMCQACSHLARTGQVCPVCGSRMFEIDDVVAALMESVIQAGGQVHQIGVASQLDLEGVGALTRFPVAV